MVKMHEERMANQQIARVPHILQISVFSTLRRFQDMNSTQNCCTSDKLATADTHKILKIVRQRHRRNPRRSLIELGSKLFMSGRKVSDIVEQGLGTKLFKMLIFHVFWKDTKPI